MARVLKKITPSPSLMQESPAMQESQNPHAVESYELPKDELATCQAGLTIAKETIECQGQRLSDMENKSRACQVEHKIFMEASESQGQRFIEMEHKLYEEKHARSAVEHRLQHILKLINSVEDVHWERARTQESFDVDGWCSWCNKIEGALEPLIRQSRV